MNPSTTREWLIVAAERASDADALAGSRQRSHGAVYMAGFAIECSLKAYLQSHHLKFPTSGREGHNLKALWAAREFRLGDLNDQTGHLTFFVTSWSTDIRYSASQADPVESTERVQAARALTGWIQTRVRRRGLIG